MPPSARILNLTAATGIVATLASGGWLAAHRANAGPVGASTSASHVTIPPPADPVSLEHAKTRGSAKATAVVLEFSDFQCPFCAIFATRTWPSVETKYVKPGAVLFAFRHFPLESIHPLARGAAVSAECAWRGGKFWEMHDAFYSRPDVLKGDGPRRLADELGLSSSFTGCASGQDVADLVDSDAAQARLLNVRSTPTFFFGSMQPDGLVHMTARLSGAISLDQFASAVEPLTKPMTTPSTN